MAAPAVEGNHGGVKMAKRKSHVLVWGVSAGVALLIVGAGALAVKTLTSDEGARRERAIQTVTLLKPPPPPPPEKIKEKPPEPEVKKEEIIEQKQVEKPQEQPQEAKESPPPGDRLGVDAEGGSGSDGFGLVANKGGAALIGGGAGGGGGGSLMSKYGWYTAIIQNDLRRLLQEYMEKNGGIPEGSCKVSLQIKLDDQGRILSYKVADACGNNRVDEAVNKVLQSARISEPPPSDMPKSIKIRISAKG
jgi:TonB family protein